MKSFQAFRQALTLTSPLGEQTLWQSENVGNLFRGPRTIVLSIFHLEGQMCKMVFICNEGGYSDSLHTPIPCTVPILVGGVFGILSKLRTEVPKSSMRSFNSGVGGEVFLVDSELKSRIQ